MSDPNFPVAEDFISIMSRVQDSAVEGLDRQLAEQRAFAAAARAPMDGVTMRELIASIEDETSKKLAALDKEITAINNAAAMAAKEETTDVTEKQFPAPILTE